MEKIVVAGGGTMGAGIAFVAAKAGYAVDLIEPDPDAQERARNRIAKNAERQSCAEVLDRINYFAAAQSGVAAELAIEAVPERLELKREVFAALARSCGAQTILATNTSSLSVADIAAGIDDPSRAAGLHFFNPPEQMQLVEIVYTGETSDEAIERARAFVARLQKTAVLAADTPGFIVNRVARPFYLQALRACEAGVAPIDDLDRLARGVGFRMGPFELMDLIGLDVNLATSDSVFERLGAERLEPVVLQREMVAQGRLGRKTGSGFYEYSAGPPMRDDALPEPAAHNSDERIVVLGFSGLAQELHELLLGAYANVELWENEESAQDIPLDTTIVVDVGDGATDRGAILDVLDAALPQETVILADAYATDFAQLARRLRFPDRIAGYGILSSLHKQRVVEIVDSEETSDDALALAQELFEAVGRRVALVEDRAGLFLGRTVGSIINEAMYVVDEQIAVAEDVDLAMRLGTNYPQGPIAWGREIGGDRVRRILQRLAAAEGAAFAPHRALWILDVESPDEAETTAEQEGAVTGAPMPADRNILGGLFGG